MACESDDICTEGFTCNRIMIVDTDYSTFSPPDYFYKRGWCRGNCEGETCSGCTYNPPYLEIFEVYYSHWQSGTCRDNHIMEYGCYSDYLGMVSRTDCGIHTCVDGECVCDSPCTIGEIGDCEGDWAHYECKEDEYGCADWEKVFCTWPGCEPGVGCLEIPPDPECTLCDTRCFDPMNDTHTPYLEVCVGSQPPVYSEHWVNSGYGCDVTEYCTLGEYRCNDWGEYWDDFYEECALDWCYSEEGCCIPSWRPRFPWTKCTESIGDTDTGGGGGGGGGGIRCYTPIYEEDRCSYRRVSTAGTCEADEYDSRNLCEQALEAGPPAPPEVILFDTEEDNNLIIIALVIGVGYVLMSQKRKKKKR